MNSLPESIVRSIFIFFFFSFTVHASEITEHYKFLKTQKEFLNNLQSSLNYDYTDKYFGHSFIHHEDINILKEGVSPGIAESAEGLVYASAMAVSGDSCYLENRGDVDITAKYPDSVNVKSVDFVSKSFGMGLLQGGAAFNNGTLFTKALGGKIENSDKKASLASLSIGIWATKSGTTPFFPGSSSTENAEECLVVNNGKIRSEASNFTFSGGKESKISAYSGAFGIYCDNTSQAVNQGEIITKAYAGTTDNTNLATSESNVVSWGIHAGKNSEILNTGSIFSESFLIPRDQLLTPPSLSDFKNIDIKSQAVGITGEEGTVIQNNGNIFVKANGKEDVDGSLKAIGIAAKKGAVIINNGEIHAESSLSDNAEVYGIVSYGNSEIYSNGKISVSSPDRQAFHVYSQNGILKVKKYTILLEKEKNIMNSLWSHSKEGSYDFSESVLYVKINKNTLFNSPYIVDRLVKDEKSKFSIACGDFTNDIKIKFLNNKESVILKYSPDFNPGIQSFVHNKSIISRSLKSLNSSFLNFSKNNKNHKKKNHFFFIPFKSLTDGKVYNAEDVGFNTGYAKKLTDKTWAGFFLGGGKGNIDFEKKVHQDRDIDHTDVFAGFYGTHELNSKLSLLISSGFFNSFNDFEDKNIKNHETAGYESKGIIASASGTYSFTPVTNLFIEPGLGLRYEHLYQENFKTDHVSWMGTEYGRIRNNAVYCEAALSIKTDFIYKNSLIEPNIKIFTDIPVTQGEFKGSMELGGQKKEIVHSYDKTSLGIQIGTLVKGKNKSFELNFFKKNSNDLEFLTGELRFNYYF